MNEYTASSQILSRVVSDHVHLDEAIPPGTAPLVQQICYGALRQYYLYDQILAHLMKKPLAAKHLDLKFVLLAGLYSIDHLKRPAHASVSHAVDAAATLNKKWASGLINAVLRRYCRETASLIENVTQRTSEARLNHPAWLIDRIEADWPSNPSIFEANNTQAPMTLRVNLQRTSRQAYLDRLVAAGIHARPGALTDTAVILGQGLSVEGLPGFADGEVSVQDEAPQLAPGFLTLAPGQVVLDACAAPGGKTCHLLESEPAISLTAIDRDSKRLGRISDNLARLGLTAEVIASDLESFEPDHLFDRILLDAPCSATGIIRRHPDIKLLRQKSDIDKLSTLQRDLINKAFDLLKPGGELLYATCSILRQENDQVVASLLADRHDAGWRSLTTRAGSTETVTTTHGLQLLPTTGSHDGFYYAVITRADS